MKTTVRLLLLSLAIVSSACSNDLDNEGIEDNNPIEKEGIIVSNNQIQSPKWLIHVVDSMASARVPGANRTKLYPWVYTIEHNSQTYVHVMDYTNSCHTCGNLVYTLSGDPIVPTTGQSNSLYDLLTELDSDHRTLVWRDVPTKSIITKAWGNLATVYTPYGSPVSDTYYRSEELSASQKAKILNDQLLEYPQAEYVDEATTTYNCHAYAWSVTEGGEKVWMGRTTNPTNTYWLDGSYISATSGSATKVSYLSDNHSVVTTGMPDIFISKWGLGPLMRHHKSHCPYDASSLSLLKKNNIPPYYIGTTSDDYSEGKTLYASGGYGGITLNAYYKKTAPTNYEWSAEFYGSCDRWYIWPSGSKADVSVYLNSNTSGGSVRVTCKMYKDNALLGTATYYVNVYSSNNKAPANQNKDENIEDA